MALTYIGNCEWEPAGEPEPRGNAGGVPQVVEVWIGRSDKLQQFLATKPLRMAYLGGYITARSAKDGSPGDGAATVDITVSLPPDFNASSSPATYAMRSAVKSGSLNNTAINARYAHYYLRRELTYESPTNRFRYYSSSRPAAARFSNNTGTIRKVKEIITVDCYDSNWKWLHRDELSWSQLPNEMKAVLEFTKKANATVEANPVEGTPWWDCVDTVTADYQGDDTSE